MDITESIREIVREELAAVATFDAGEPELITPAEAMRIMGGIDKSTFWAIANDPENNRDFPITRLSRNTNFVDKRRLVRWLANGGLGVKA